jgi:pimeloyl-ACP methyl ester carboxylesterase
MTSLAALLFAATTLGFLGERADLLRCGGDLSEGVLINRTPGSAPADPIDPARPTVVFIHGYNPMPRTVHFEMAQRLSEAIGRRPGGGSFNVLDWNWNGATCAGFRVSTNTEAAVAQGPLLAGALLRSGLEPGRVHIIGHSAGSIVAASAAQSIARTRRAVVAQVTFLEPAAFYHSVLFERLAVRAAATRVENYWADGPSGYGQFAPYGGVMNARIQGSTPWLGIVMPTRSGHLDIVRWYVATAEHPECPLGFNASVLLEKQRESSAEGAD